MNNICTVEKIEFNGESIYVRKEEGYSSIYETDNCFFQEYRFQFHKYFIIVYIGNIDFVKINNQIIQKHTETIIIDNIDIKPIIEKINATNTYLKCPKCNNDDFIYTKDSTSKKNLIICSNCKTIVCDYFRSTEQQQTIN